MTTKKQTTKRLAMNIKLRKQTVENLGKFKLLKLKGRKISY